MPGKFNFQTKPYNFHTHKKEKSERSDFEVTKEQN